MSYTTLLEILEKVTNFQVRASANIQKVNGNIVILDPGSDLDSIHIFNIEQRLHQDTELLGRWHAIGASTGA